MNQNKDSDYQSNLARTERIGENIVVPIVEEQATVGKRVTETGRVRVSKVVREHEETIDVPLLKEEVKVERVPVNEYADTPPPIRHDGAVTIIPVVREVVVKRFLVVEEIHISKHTLEMHAQETVSLLKEEVSVERLEINKQ